MWKMVLNQSFILILIETTLMEIRRQSRKIDMRSNAINLK